MIMSGSTPNTEPDHSLVEAVIHVAAGVLRNAGGEILVARRHDHADQGGLWEFPGGKVEAGETARQALSRELEEELGIRVRESRPLVRVPHSYPHRRVVLDVFDVTAFDGEPHGREGQPVRWVAPNGLNTLAFPAANRPIVAAARLPERLLITPEPGLDHARFLAGLDRSIAANPGMVQLRAHGLSPREYRALASEAVGIASRHGVPILVNASPEMCIATGASGVHLTSTALGKLNSRPLSTDLWVSASCHSPAELDHAVRVGVDFVVLGPVRTTASHPQAPPLGLDRFREWVRDVPLPVYALGGMGPGDWCEVRELGGQGVAGIGAFWAPE